nr:expressed protein [Hymenolepis microstoma]
MSRNPCTSKHPTIRVYSPQGNQLSTPAIAPQNSSSPALNSTVNDLLQYVQHLQTGTPYTGSGPLPKCVDKKEYNEGNSHIREEVHELNRPGVNCTIKVKQIKTANSSPFIRSRSVQPVMRRSLPPRLDEATIPDWHLERLYRAPALEDCQLRTRSASPLSNFRYPYDAVYRRDQQSPSSYSLSSGQASSNEEISDLSSISPAAALYEKMISGNFKKFKSDKQLLRFILDHVIAEKPFNKGFPPESYGFCKTARTYRHQSPEFYPSRMLRRPNHYDYGSSQNNRRKFVPEDNWDYEVDYDDSASLDDEQLDSLEY